jgi:hypothetical protein
VRRASVAGDTNNTLRTPGLGVVLLALYTGAAIAAGWAATTRRDFA